MRRSLWAVGMAVLLVVSLGGCVWTAVGFDATRDSSNPYETQLTVGNVATLGQAWTVATGETPAHPPVTFGPGVYFATGQRVRAYEAVNGASRWTHDYGADALNEPNLVSDILVASEGVYTSVHQNVGLQSAEFRIDRLDSATGTSGSWHYDLPAQPGQPGTLAAPALIGTRLYLGNWVEYDTTTSTGNLPIAAGDGSPDRGPAAVGGGHVHSGVSAFDAAGVSSCNGGNPINFCSPLWSYAPSATPTGPVYTPGAVFMGTSGGTLEAFDPNGCVSSPCAPLWTGTAAGSITAAPAVANGVVFVGSSNGTLYAFNAAGCGGPTCSPLWSVSTGGALKAQPSVANGVVVFGSDDGKVYAVNAAGCGSATCSPLWSSAAGAAVETQVAVAAGSLYVSRTDGSLTAYRLGS